MENRAEQRIDSVQPSLFRRFAEGVRSGLDATANLLDKGLDSVGLGGLTAATVLAVGSLMSAVPDLNKANEMNRQYLSSRFEAPRPEEPIVITATAPVPELALTRAVMDMDPKVEVVANTIQKSDSQMDVFDSALLDRARNSRSDAELNGILRDKRFASAKNPAELLNMVDGVLGERTGDLLKEKLEKLNSVRESVVKPSVSKGFFSSSRLLPMLAVLGTTLFGGAHQMQTPQLDFSSSTQAMTAQTMTAETFAGIVSESPSVEKADTAQDGASSLAEIQPDATSLNKLLLEKNDELVKVTGGEGATYLHNTGAHAHFVGELSKPGRGFSAVLSHPEVAKAKTIAEMVNLVETHFGEKVADLVESNAAAMHLSASQIQALR